MKYHYQYVSKTTVRIEIIPEDKKEAAKIEQLSTANDDQTQLLAIYAKGLDAYIPGASLVKTNFMNFPTVALCKFMPVREQQEKVA